MSISQISETLFILAIPFFLKRFGIKYVMLISMIAWFFRFGLLAYGNPAEGLWMIVGSCIVYGMAFDFFNVSGSLFVEGNTEPSIRSSAQGLFMMMTNGIGAILGSYLSGILIQQFFMLKFQSVSELTQYLGVKQSSPVFQRVTEGVQIHNGQFSSTVMMKDWSSIWITFALYSLFIAVLFALLFRHKHDPDSIGEATH
jgi:NHS family xanthosine MFS transporter